jgi:hypothetical protein
LDANILETDSLDALIAAPKPLWIITRANRISEGDRVKVAAAGYRLEAVTTPTTQEVYRVYRLF